MGHTHRALSACPVCGDGLVTTRLGCPGCGTELVGSFAPCPFCALDDADLDLLTVFLVSRGNLKEIEKHLGVSYPTARSRFNAVLDRLGLLDAAASDAEVPDAQAPGTADAPAGASEGEARDGATTGVRTDEAPAAGGSGSGGDAIRDQVLAQVAAGTLTPDAAADLLGRLR